MTRPPHRNRHPRRRAASGGWKASCANSTAWSTPRSATPRIADDKKATPAEAIRIVFDPDRISYEDILRFYFTMHDPTTKNRQGNDRGAEYRSAIFVLDDESARDRPKWCAARSTPPVSGESPWSPRSTGPATFKEADEHHQDYLKKNPGGYTCHYVRGD